MPDVIQRADVLNKEIIGSTEAIRRPVSATRRLRAEIPESGIRGGSRKQHISLKRNGGRHSGFGRLIGGLGAASCVLLTWDKHARVPGQCD
jgi:hypothetical protein